MGVALANVLLMDGFIGAGGYQGNFNFLKKLLNLEEIFESRASLCLLLCCLKDYQII